MGYVYLFRCITWTLWEYCATPASAQNVHGPRRLPISKAVAHGLARHSCTALCLVAPLRWGKRDGPKHYLCKWQSNLLTAQNNGTDVMRLETAKFQSLCAWLLIYILTLNNDKWHIYNLKNSKYSQIFQSIQMPININFGLCGVYSSATPYFVVGPEPPPRPLRN